MNPYYTDYSEFLGRIFPGRKMQKLSVNIGAGCPNRDGTISYGGCIYCDNSSFTPAYCSPGLSVADQIEAGRMFFARKYPQMRYLAYFQSHTNTYGATEERLMELYHEAAAAPGVDGIIIATRPDCVADSMIRRLAALDRATRVMLEFGVESCHDRTLKLINRGHTFADTVSAIERCSDAGLLCGAHVIAGLPGESDDDALETIDGLCRLPVSTIKLHQLQIVAGTTLESRWRAGKLDVRLHTPESYLDFCCRVVDIVPRSIAIERFVSQSPAGMLAAPAWGLKNHEFTHRLMALLASRKTASHSRP